MRTKRFALNFLSDFIPQAVILVLSVYKMSIMLTKLGDDQFGVYQLFSQIVAYLILIEGGVGSATLFRLYQPIREGNRKQVASIIKTSKYVFNIICLLIVGIGGLLMLVVPFFIKQTALEMSYIQFSFLLYVISQASYYFTVTERTVFDAHQKKYIPNVVYQTVNIVRTVAEIVVVMLGGRLLSIVVSLLVISLLANLVLKLIYLKHYGTISTRGKKDFTMLKDVKHLAVNTVGNLVANNIDILILSKILGSTSVVIYSMYNFIVVSLKGLIEKITGAIMSPIGDLILENRAKAFRVFKEFALAMNFIALAICVPLLFSINGFVDVVYKGNVQTTQVLAMLFCGLLYCELARIPLKVYTLSSGFFKDVKNFVIAESILNLTLSLFLVQKIGVAGVLIGTIASFLLADLIPKAIVVHRRIFQQKPTFYAERSLFYGAWFGLACGLFMLWQFKPTNLLTWFGGSVTIFAINGAMLLAVFKLRGDLVFLNRIKLFKRRKYEN